jgi:hypothetical protein
MDECFYSAALSAIYNSHFTLSDPNGTSDRAIPIISLFDFKLWCGVRENNSPLAKMPAILPRETWGAGPADSLEETEASPTAAAPEASDNDRLIAEWFVTGYAVRALEDGKPATRNEARDAAVKEARVTMRQAEKAHATLPERLKNPDRSKGGGAR